MLKIDKRNGGRYHSPPLTDDEPLCEENPTLTKIESVADVRVFAVKAIRTQVEHGARFLNRYFKGHLFLEDKDTIYLPFADSRGILVGERTYHYSNVDVFVSDICRDLRLAGVKISGQAPKERPRLTNEQKMRDLFNYAGVEPPKNFPQGYAMDDPRYSLKDVDRGRNEPPRRRKHGKMQE